MQAIKPLSINQLHGHLPARRLGAHKHELGHVLVIGSDYGYPGAAVLAALGALRSGAGLVTLATHQEHLLGLGAVHPELMVLAIDKPEILKNFIEKTNVIVLGPGMGRSAWSEEIFKIAITCPQSIVVDASALHYVAEFNLRRHNWVLTPHPGEAAILLDQEIKISPEQRPTVCTNLISHYEATVVLKGAGTLVGSPNTELGICKAGNPGMATAGMGDLLSGVIAGLIAQGLSLDIAAKLAVCVHATAGDQAAVDGQKGMITSDLLPYIRKLLT